MIEIDLTVILEGEEACILLLVVTRLIGRLISFFTTEHLTNRPFALPRQLYILRLNVIQLYNSIFLANG